MKDPAFLFYSQDFLSGISDLTFEERGQYITLICLEHSKGRLSEKLIQLNIPNISTDVLEKFEVDEDGNYFNKRLEEEINKRKLHSQKQKERAQKRWEKNNEQKNNGNATAMPNEQALPEENENENENEIEDKNTFEKSEKLSSEDATAEEPKADHPIIPWPTVDFQEAWQEWKAYKKEEFNFRYKSEKSEEKALSELKNLSGGNKDEAIKIINQSMAKGWKGLFQVKSKNPNPSNSPPKFNYKKAQEDMNQTIENSDAKWEARYGNANQEI